MFASVTLNYRRVGTEGGANLQDETAALKVEEAGVCLFSSFLSFHKYLNFQTGQMQSTDH